MNDLRSKSTTDPSGVSTGAEAGGVMAVTTTNLTMRFGRTDVLSKVNLHVPKGAVYALLGRNGAGKSTLLQLTLGILRPTSGSINALGLDPQKNGPKLRQRIGYIPEKLPLYDWMTVDQIIRFVADQYNEWSREEENRLVAKFRLDRTKHVRDLSRGNLALLSLVMAMSHKPDLVLLDECTSGMDAIFRAEFDRTVIETLHEAQHTVVFASHQLRELEFLCDWVGIIHQGKLLLELPVDELKASVKTFRLKSPDGVVPELLQGELARQSLGREWLVTVRSSDLSSPALHRDTVLLETIDLSLEQIFVALLSEPEERT